MRYWWNILNAQYSTSPHPAQKRLKLVVECSFSGRFCSLNANKPFADAKFWVGVGDKPTPQGVRVADENGKETPLRRYDHKTIVLTLPGDLTVFDIGHFSVWCEAFTVDFGHVTMPTSFNVPPSLKMLGVLPQVSGPRLVRQMFLNYTDSELKEINIQFDSVFIDYIHPNKRLRPRFTPRAYGICRPIVTNDDGKSQANVKIGPVFADEYFNNSFQSQSIRLSIDYFRKQKTI